MASASSTYLKNLEIQAIVLAAMCAMLGVYMTLFVIAFLLTMRRRERVYRNLRVVTIAMFIANVIHVIARSLVFNQARITPQPSNAYYQMTIPLHVAESLATAIAGTISDGLLAYRFWVVFNRKRWALYMPAVAIGITFLLGVSQSLVNLGVYRHRHDTAYPGLVELDVLKITAAWAWSMFAVNTTLTLLIVVRIIRVSRASKDILCSHNRTPHSLIAEVIIESALVTWIGLLFYEITSLAPQGHYTANMNVDLVAVCILPFFFGISQCLITVRLSLLKLSEEQPMDSLGVVSINAYTTRVVDYAPANVVFGTQTHSSDTIGIRSVKTIIKPDSDPDRQSVRPEE